ncbi:MAG TPA: NAD+ synthase [Vicinamibacterales bacterium]|jgi:NAD+ synthetase|nr:NAD+ synthase [Vicinamibacterales bacterium]
MRLALAQLNFTVGAFDANFVKIADAIRRAQAVEADLIVFSELATTGYPPRDLLNHPRFIDMNLDLLDRVAALSTSRLAVLIGFVDCNPSREGKGLFNAAALCRNGRVVARRYKSLLPSYDVFDEDRYFEPAHHVEPISLDDTRVGVTICEDVWNDRDFWPKRLYNRDPVCELAAQNARLLINISASPFNLGKADLRRQMIRQEAIKNGRYFFYVNQVGGNDELVFDGHSIGIDTDGREVVRAHDFAEDFIVHDVPLSGEDAAPASPIIRDVSGSDEEAAHRALVLGLGDYTRKCGFANVVIGLSGGIDSALTACLAVDALGPEHVLTVAMPTRYSSEHSLTDAAALARTLDVEHRVIPIDTILQAYLDLLEPVLEGCRAGATEENIQARIRGAVLMALSNRLGHLLLTTGNKSELAVGYCTLYGDMCGGLAVISDVPKTFVYRLARYINRNREVIPQSILTKAPSAELRPNQKDSDTLPPYEMLDEIVEAYVERHLDIDAICQSGIDPAIVVDVVRRIDASEYKRRQAAPGIRISSKAFGVGRRYPIAADYRNMIAGRTPVG